MKELAKSSPAKGAGDRTRVRTCGEIGSERALSQTGATPSVVPPHT
jgi:hypothetical protein